MASGAVPDGVLRTVFEGCISGYDSCIERRPYHRNCGCALHNKSGNSKKNCSHKVPRCDKVSYPMRKAWSEGSLLALATASNSAHSSSSFNSSLASAGCRSQLKEEENHC